MILFIAPNPHNVSQKEGFLQRVAAIDNMFPHEKKVYYDDFSDFSKLAGAAIKADMIYVHSLYFAEKILSALPLLGDKIVIDLHGVVPEEEEYSGNTERSIELGDAEEIVFRHCTNFVAVSESMVEHFKRKYKTAHRSSWVVLPIFNVNKVDISKKRITSRVIYAGGSQRWQNVDLMVDAMNRISDYSYTILTHTPEAFTDKLSPSTLERTMIKTVASTEVQRYYKKASLGFILRDNITINNVACPTKLIEYLGEGVVPIVKTPKIGDFARLGYKYFTVDEFTSGRIEVKDIKTAMVQNLAVLGALSDQTLAGTKQLKQLFRQIKNNSQHSNSQPIRGYVEACLLLDKFKNESLQRKHHVEHLEGVVREYAKTVEYYKTLYEESVQARRRALIKSISRRMKYGRDKFLP